MILVLTAFIISDKLIILFDNPILPFDKMKQILLIVTIVTFQTAIFKTYMMKEEKRNNLIRFKFLYYIMINDNFYHKLNYNNYKIFKLIVSVIHLVFIKFFHPHLYLILFILATLFIILKSITLIFLSPLFLYGIYVYITSLLVSLSIIFIVLIYYIMRFNQINTQMRLFLKIKVPSKFIIQTIKEHKEISLLIHDFNLIMNKSVACIFIITTAQIDLLIYLVFYTKSIHYKIMFVQTIICAFIPIFTINILLIKLSSSAHRSYNIMYPIIIRKTLPYRIKFKVK